MAFEENEVKVKTRCIDTESLTGWKVKEVSLKSAKRCECYECKKALRSLVN